MSEVEREYRGGLKIGPVLLSNSQTEKGRKRTQSRDHSLAHLSTYCETMDLGNDFSKLGIVNYNHKSSC